MNHHDEVDHEEHAYWDAERAREHEEERPTWTKPCERCGQTVERWRGQGDVTCHRCGASYSAGGQRLRDDWRGNPSWSDDSISDLEGFEIQQLRAEGSL